MTEFAPFQNRKEHDFVKALCVEMAHAYHALNRMDSLIKDYLKEKRVRETDEVKDA